jgi:putative multiple sugar transport system ATP-binding protein
VIIHQELALIPELSITENIFLGNEIRRAAASTGPREAARGRASPASASRRTRTRDQAPRRRQAAAHRDRQGAQQGRQAAHPRRADRGAQRDDSQHLLDLILGLKAKGITSIIISHKLNEIEQIADEITIIRDGRTVETLDVGRGEITRTASSAAWSAARWRAATPTAPRDRRRVLRGRGLVGAHPRSPSAWS